MKRLDENRVGNKHKLFQEYDDGKNVLLNSGEQISAGTMIWAAGVKGNIPIGVDKSLIARGNRITTDRYCRVTGYNNIYAIGDLAYMETPAYKPGIRKWHRWLCNRPTCLPGILN